MLYNTNSRIYLELIGESKMSKMQTDRKMAEKKISAGHKGFKQSTKPTGP